jgi:AcrR family transcriptional regulator
MSRPDQVTTYFTERRWVPESANAQLREGERRLGRQWEAVILGVRPGVSRPDAGVRERALNGALTVLASRRTDIPKQRLAALFTQGVLALLTAAAAPAAPADAAPVSRAWEPPQSRRHEIRQAAALLFRRYGYRQVGVDQIGKAAGVSGPTVYGTYGSKAEILADVCDYAVIKTEIEIERALAQADSAGEALELIVGVYAELALDDANVVVLLGRELQELPEADQLRLWHRRASMHKACVAVLRQVRPELSEPEASILFAAARSSAQRVALMRRRGEVPSVPAVADLLVRFLLGT